MSLPLLTPRLELRRFEARTWSRSPSCSATPRSCATWGRTRRPLDAGQVAASRRRADEHWEEQGFGPLAVVERASGRLIGEAGLQLLEAGPDIELTYTLARAAWGRGYATEAARAVLLWGFSGLRLQRIVAVACPANAASLRVLEKLGMAPVGTRDCYGARLAEYALTLGEWRASEGAPRPSILEE